MFQSGHEAVKVNEAVNTGKTGKVVDSVNQKIAKNPNISGAVKKKMLTQPKPAQKLGLNYSVGRNNIPKDGSFASANVVIQDSTYKQYLARQSKLESGKRDGFVIRTITKKVLTYHEKYGNMADEVFVEELKHNIPKMMFLLLPIAAVIIGVTFRKNKKFYVEHLIFAFHLHCFLFLFLSIILLLQKPIPETWDVAIWINVLATLYITWYMYRSLRVVYQRSTFRTITKLIGISVTYLVAFLLCFGMVLFFTALI